MYDTIVIGNDFSSLIAAVTAVNHGGKTILLSNDTMAHTYAESDYTFNADPMPLSGFGTGQIFSRFIAECDNYFLDENIISLSNPGLQIISPRHRIDLFHNIDDLITDIETELSENKLEIRDFYVSMLKMSDITDAWIRENPSILPRHYRHCVAGMRKIPEILKQRLLLSDSLRNIRNNNHLKIIYEAELLLLSNLDADGKHLLSPMLSYVLSLPYRGLYYCKGGKGVLVNALTKTFTSSGGHFIANGSIVGIDPSEEAIVTVNGCNESHEIKGKNLIISIKSEAFDLLLRHNTFTSFQRRLKRSKTQYYPFTLHMGVLDRGIPEKMGHYVAIVVEERKSVMENNIIFLEISAPGEKGRAPANRRAMSATVFLKDSPQCATNDELKERSEIIIGHLESFLPFLRENLDYLNIEKSIEFSRKYQGIMNQKYRIRAHPLFGVCALANTTSLKNIFLTGGMLLAGLGFEGEIISGINAALSAMKRRM
jgi:phytoene dehydrogenase-like protein